MGGWDWGKLGRAKIYGTEKELAEEEGSVEGDFKKQVKVPLYSSTGWKKKGKTKKFRGVIFGKGY